MDKNEIAERLDKIAEDKSIATAHRMELTFLADLLRKKPLFNGRS
jgi:hypothetical protein